MLDRDKNLEKNQQTKLVEDAALEKYKLNITMTNKCNYLKSLLNLFQ